MPRVLALTHVFPRWEGDPSAPFLLTWARALAAAGNDVAVLAPHDAGLPRRHVVAGVPVALVRYAPEERERLAYRGEMHQLVRSPAGAGLAVGLVGALAAELRRQVRLGRPHVVHVHWWVPGAIAARLAGLDVPTVLTVHGTDVAMIESHPRLATVARWAMNAADRVEAVSSDLAMRLKRVTGRAADAVNPMPLDEGWLSPRSDASAGDGRFTVLGVGRMVPEKGFADVIDALAGLEEPSRLVLVGDGPERGRLVARAAAAGLALELPGRLMAGELREAYARASVVVQASHREGLGLVAAEALCTGTPVVATDSGGTRDVLDAERLVPVGDVAALRAALAEVAEDPVAARARSRAGAERVRQRLSPDAAAQRTLAGYRELLTIS